MNPEDSSAKPFMSGQLGHIALLLEAVLAELRYMRGLTSEDEAYRKSQGADFQRPLAEFQEQRRRLF
jgi:hypothetical protein